LSQAITGRCALFFADRLGHPADHRHVHQAVGRVRRRLDQDHRDAALAHRFFGRRRHRLLVDSVRKPDRRDTHVEEGLREQRFGAAIKRLRMQYGVARAHERH
jgi:hypothetical protein